MPCIPPMSCTLFMPHSPPSTRKPSPHLPLRRVKRAPLALPRSSPPSPPASPVAPGNALPQYYPTRALPRLPVTQVQTRVTRHADQGLGENGTAPTCTTPAGAPAPATDSRSIACKPPSCALLSNSRLPPCVRPGTRRSPFLLLRHRHRSVAVACTQDRTTPGPRLVRHFADRSCVRKRRPAHPTPCDPPAPFLPAKIPMPLLAAQGLREPLGGRAHARARANLGSLLLLPSLPRPQEIPTVANYGSANCAVSTMQRG